jgi:DNA-binding response OmpR family regulator
MSETRILLVDDEPGIVKMLTRRLESQGYRVALALDGDEVFRRLEEARPDLVILDVMLPKTNGYDVCRRIKADQRFRGIPVIMLTAMAQEKDRRQGFECGADAYVRKPFRSPELLETVQEFLGGNGKRNGDAGQRG